MLNHRGSHAQNERWRCSNSGGILTQRLSVLYEEELYDDMLAAKYSFASQAECELRAIRYEGDAAGKTENHAWLVF